MPDSKGFPHTRKGSAAWVVGASGAFWFSWLLSPGVGLIDAMNEAVQLAGYRISIPIVLRLISVVAYARGLTCVLRFDHRDRTASARIGSTFVLIGAIGLSARGMFRTIAPDVFVLAFFGGHAVLVPALRNRGPLSQLGLGALLASPVVALIGWVAIRSELVARPIVGLTILGAVTSSLALLALSTAPTPIKHDAAEGRTVTE